jgi:hypothetical protein
MDMLPNVLGMMSGTILMKKNKMKLKQGKV